MHFIRIVVVDFVNQYYFNLKQICTILRYENKKTIMWQPCGI